jgi:hypothetical protein
VSPAPFPTPSPDAGCLRGSQPTALKWRGDGELSDQDLQTILERLRGVDPAGQALVDHFQGAALQLD